MTFKNAQCIVKIGNNLSEPFNAGASYKVISYAAISSTSLWRDREVAVSKFAEEAGSIGLAVNESKTKYERGSISA